MRYRSSGNYVMPEGEVNTLPSLTVPDMSISLKVLLEKYTRGQQLPQSFVPTFSDEFVPDPRSLDLVDLQEMRANLNTRSDEIKEFIKSNSVKVKGSVGSKTQSEVQVSDNETTGTSVS